MFNYKKLRRDLGLLQKDISETMSLSQPGFSKYENENTEPSMMQYNALCEKYGKDKIDSYFFEDETNKDKEYQADAELIQLIIKQNATISKQLELFHSLSLQLSEINTKLNQLLNR